MKSLLFLIILLSCMSCVPPHDTPGNKFLQCDSNCYELKVNGQIINKTTNTGISGILVTLEWDKVDCWFCFNNTIDTTYSDSNGYYNFDVLIDTTYFIDGYNLDIEIPEDSTYLLYLDPFKNSIYEVPDSSENVLNFKLQPAAQLEIHLNRIEIDTFQNFSVSCHFSDKVLIWVATGVRNSNNASNEVITISTAADKKTYIIWDKVLNNIKTTKKDSIICKQNKKNIFQLNY